MRGRVAIFAMSLTLIAAALPASAAAVAKVEAPPTEKVFLEFPSRHGFQIYVEVEPLVGVAVIRTFKGEGPLSVGRSSSTGYVARIPAGPAEGRLDFEIPGVASIAGELVATKQAHGESTPASCPGSPAPSEGVEFRGSFDFTGSGGYLSFDADHGEGDTDRSGDPCEAAPEEPRPDLFTYLEGGAEFTNHNSAVLNSELSLPGRLTFFLAAHFVDDGGSLFEARSLEWLPGRVAAERTFDLVPAPGADFHVSSKAEHPASATVHPPAPFSGRAHYSKTGHKLTGSLSVDILGKRVRLAGARTKANLFNLNPGL
jgi:hypothetical protein